MKTTISISIFLAVLTLTSCGSSNSEFDATGTFEAEETIISSQASGQLMEFQVSEGETLNENQLIGYVDSLQLHYRKLQIKAQIDAALSITPDVQVQLASLREQMSNLNKEKARVEKLVADQVAPKKQLDDINYQISVLNRQIDAQLSTLSNSAESTNKNAQSLYAQLWQIEDQLNKCKIVNPLKGTVIAKYTNQSEITANGKPLYKIADLSTMTLKCYVSGNQLAKLKIGQNVKVQTDNGEGAYKDWNGTVYWINDKSEFTPKTVQTKDERANSVYAVKVKVQNDGSLKIGMYGQIKL